jgi:hypothetical protein
METESNLYLLDILEEAEVNTLVRQNLAALDAYHKANIKGTLLLTLIPDSRILYDQTVIDPIGTGYIATQATDYIFDNYGGGNLVQISDDRGARRYWQFNFYGKDYAASELPSPEGSSLPFYVQISDTPPPEYREFKRHTQLYDSVKEDVKQQIVESEKTRLHRISRSVGNGLLRFLGLNQQTK